MELIELNVLVYLTLDLLRKSGIFLPGPRGRPGWKVKFSSRLWGSAAGEEQASFISCHAFTELIQGLKRYKNRVLSDPRLAYDWLKPSCCLWSYVQITYSPMNYVICCYKCWSCKLPVNLNLCWASQPQEFRYPLGMGTLKYYKVAYFYFLKEIWRAVLDLQWKAQWKKGSQGSFWSLQLQYSFVCLKYENSYYE